MRMLFVYLLAASMASFPLVVDGNSDKCFLPYDTGPCRGSQSSWYYTSEGGCSPFFYGGCDGNDNRFFSKESCGQECEALEIIDCSDTQWSNCCANGCVHGCDSDHKQQAYDGESKGGNCFLFMEYKWKCCYKATGCREISIANSPSKCGNMKPSTSCQITCDPGYVLEDTSVNLLVCGNDKNGYSSKPACVKRVCQDDPDWEATVETDLFGGLITLQMTCESYNNAASCAYGDTSTSGVDVRVGCPLSCETCVGYCFSDAMESDIAGIGFKNQFVATIQDCQNLCFAEDDCLAIQYSNCQKKYKWGEPPKTLCPSDGNCFLHSTTDIAGPLWKDFYLYLRQNDCECEFMDIQECVGNSNEWTDVMSQCECREKCVGESGNAASGGCCQYKYAKQHCKWVKGVEPTHSDKVKKAALKITFVGARSVNYSAVGIGLGAVFFLGTVVFVRKIRRNQFV